MDLFTTYFDVFSQGMNLFLNSKDFTEVWNIILLMIKRV